MGFSMNISRTPNTAMKTFRVLLRGRDDEFIDVAPVSAWGTSMFLRLTARRKFGFYPLMMLSGLTSCRPMSRGRILRGPIIEKRSFEFVDYRTTLDIDDYIYPRSFLV